MEALHEPTTAEVLAAWLERSNAFPGAHDRHAKQLAGSWVAACRTCGWESDPVPTRAEAMAAALDHPPIVKPDETPRG